MSFQPETYNPFMSALPELSSKESMYGEVMQGVGLLASQFALAMKQRQMPVDQLTSNVRVNNKGNVIDRTVTRLPYWTVLEDVNITDDSMVSGHLMLGTHRYNRGEYGTKSKIQKKEDTCRSLNYGDRILYWESQVVVTPQGELGKISKSLNATRDSVNGHGNHYSSFNPDFFGFEYQGPAKAEDLIDLSTALSAQEIIRIMTERMKKSQERYSQKFYEERKLGPIVRDSNYYYSADVTEHIPVTQPQPPVRGILSKLFKR